MKQPLFKLAVPILALPRAAKRFVALSVDLGLCVLTVWLAFYLRLGEFVALSGTALWAVGASVGIALPIFVVSGLYRAIFRYSGWPALLVVDRAVGIIQPILLLLFVGASRALARVWLGDQYLSILKRASPPQGVDLWRRHRWPPVGRSHGPQPRNSFGQCRAKGARRITQPVKASLVD